MMDPTYKGLKVGDWVCVNDRHNSTFWSQFEEDPFCFVFDCIIRYSNHNLPETYNVRVTIYHKGCRYRNIIAGFEEAGFRKIEDEDELAMLALMTLGQ